MRQIEPYGDEEEDELEDTRRHTQTMSSNEGSNYDARTIRGKPPAKQSII
jgi:hypothetical protein